MYLAHFGFAEWPFANTPDPRFVYLSPRHEEALAHLLYGVREQGGFVQLTGEVGTGKTTICRYLLAQLPAGVDVALVVNPMLTPEELLETVCDELGAQRTPQTFTRKGFVDALYRHLLAAHARGRRTVLIVDEAQDLSADALEQLRLLTNLETATEKLMQIILIGQPELTTLLARTELRQVAQRITARYHLRPFGERDTRAYVWRRLQIAGQRTSIFEPRALAAVHRASRGVPRLVNVVCDRALLGAYALGKRTVDARTVRRAAREVAGEGTTVRRWPRAVAAVAAIAVALVAVAAGLAGAWRVSSGEAWWRVLTPPFRSDPSAPVAAAAAPAAEPAPVTTIAPVRLGALLASLQPPGDRAAAIARLLALWGVVGAPNDDQCRLAARAELECFDGRGTWTVLRRLGVPVTIKLLAADGGRHWAVVTALASDAITLELGPDERTVPLAAVEPLWDGMFSLVWRPVPGAARTLSLGMQGPGVAWLRRALGNGAAAERPAVYDEALAERVVAFQKREGLEPDGVAGIETLLRLSVRQDQRAPLLPAAPPGR